MECKNNMSIQDFFPQLVFFGFATVLVFSALMVIVSRNSVRSALFLVLAFFATAGIWLLLEAEFLGLVLILVYVGAVMTLFLFVVMTLNVGREKTQAGFVRYLPYGFAVIVMLVVLMIYVIGPKHFSATQAPIASAANYSNVVALGDVLYTDYAYSFELAGVILLIAIIAVIALSLHAHPNGNTKNSSKVPPVFRREERIRIVKMNKE